MCLISIHQISAVREYDIRRCYDSHHSDRFRHLPGNDRMDGVRDVSDLRKQQSITSHIV